jgi:hypothetical protein
MRNLVIFAAVAALAACSQQIAQDACIVDGAVQPIAVAVGQPVAEAAGFGPEADLAANLDKGVHAAIVAECARIGGTVQPAAPTPSATPSAAPAK